MDFREILRNLLIEFDCTQTELANKLNIKPSQISEWLKGKANPGYETLRNIASTLNLSADYLLGLEDDFGVKTHNEINVATTYSAEERRLVDYFRQLSPNMQRIALNTLRGMTGEGSDSLHKKA